MANSIDDLLSKSSQEQQDKFKGLVADATQKTQSTLKVQEAGQEAPTTRLQETKTPTPQSMKEAEKVTERNPPAQGTQQPPQQENAIDRVLSEKAKAATTEQGQTLAKQGVTAEKDQDRSR
jgi:hypothetical protein